ncbi:MAG: methyltransferase domain-containing protein [Bacillota bacterium]|nr:methyltransferase domain-containing protein [Bacillota bacterium]
MNNIKDDVKEYYGRVLNGTKDLKTKACCCSTDSLPEEVKDALNLIDDEIISHYYGCGSPIPPLLDGLTVLDLGCGSGRDVYVVSKLVGENGHVIGIDMTQEQLDIAKRYEESQKERFGYEKSNVDFRQGYIEDLASAGIADASVDIVISNCVINLSPYKQLTI